MSVNILRPGLVTKKKLKILLNLMSVRSDNKIRALYMHLCLGRTEHRSAILNDVDPGNFRRLLISIEKVAKICEEYKEHDLYDIDK